MSLAEQETDSYCTALSVTSYSLVLVERCNPRIPEHVAEGGGEEPKGTA